MKFYRRLSTIKAISFDLDDTLYSNKPVMQVIEKKMIAYFDDLLYSTSHRFIKPDICFNHQYWFEFRQQAIKQNPELKHDVVRVRLVTYRKGFESLGFASSDALKMAQEALDYFISLRSNFTVPQESIKLLATLSRKYPLVAISNGNVDAKAIGIDHYFTHIYHAGWQSSTTLLKQKPSGDMFAVACQDLGILPDELLHVGDCGRADIQGALAFGCQAAWLSCYDVGQPIRVIPHLELTSISQLARL